MVRVNPSQTMLRKMDDDGLLIDCKVYKYLII